MGNNKVPEIRFYGFSEDWEERKLGQVKDTRDGTHDSPKYYEIGYPLVTSKNLTDSGLDMSDVSLISVEDFKSINKRSKVDIGDIIFGMIGTIGNPVIVDRCDFAIKNVALIKDDGDVQNQFLLQLLKSPIFERYIQNENVGNTQKFLGLNKIRDYNFLTPNLNEQTAIGNFFKQLDDTIALHKRELDSLKQTKQGFLQKMFPKEGESVPELRFSGFSGDWEERKLGDIGSTFTGLSGKSKDDFGHGEAEFITYMNVFSNTIADINGTENIEIDTKQTQVKFGDVFFTTSSETPNEVGMSSIWLENVPNVYLNSFCFGYRLSSIVDLYYFAFVLRSPEIRKKLMLLAQGISRYNISKNRVMDILISLPTLQEQTAIGNFFKKLDDTIALHERELENLKQTKKAFLQKMFI